jgi:hypothetical protein
MQIQEDWKITALINRDHLGVLTENPCTNPHTHFKIPQIFRGLWGTVRGKIL